MPDYNRQSPTRYLYLSMIYPKPGASLWSDKHLWSGLLTGFNSAGERLVKKLQHEAEK